MSWGSVSCWRLAVLRTDHHEASFTPASAPAPVMSLVSSSPSAPSAAAPIERAAPPKLRPAPRPAPRPRGPRQSRATWRTRRTPRCSRLDRRGGHRRRVGVQSRAVSQRGALGLMQLMPGTAACSACAMPSILARTSRPARGIFASCSTASPTSLARARGVQRGPAGGDQARRHAAVSGDAGLRHARARARRTRAAPAGSHEHPERDGVVRRATARLRPDEATFAPIVRYAVLTDDLGVSARSLPSPSTEVAVAVAVKAVAGARTTEAP